GFEMAERLSWIIKNGDLEAVQRNINESNVNKMIDGRYPIHYAADYGHTGVIEYLINIGADVNVTDVHGITALLAAVFEGHKDVVVLLLSKGARRDTTAPDGRSILDCTSEDDIKQILATNNCSI
uniref:Myotrophin n=1 Tax=Parascaris univalens TaxID=6257 RepID=A0A914ZLA3_PARUN